MPNIVVTYENAADPPATVSGTSISLRAVVGGAYEHDDKAVKQLDIDLDTSTSATLTVTSSGTTMPAQTCFTSHGPSKPGPFKTEWRMTGTATGTMTLSIPAGTTARYFARMILDGGSDVDINVKR